MRQWVYIESHQYKTSTYHADVPFEIFVMFKKMFREPLFRSPSLISCAREFRLEELERRSLVKKMVKVLKREWEKAEGHIPNKKKKSREGSSSKKA